MMTETLAGRGGSFAPPSDKAAEHNTEQAENNVRSGGCPGDKAIMRWYGKGDPKNCTIDEHDVRLALETFRETDELAAWHADNNPQAKPWSEP
jgi:hypothetical protein